MMDWGLFGLAFGIFMLSHRLPLLGTVRPVLVARLGPRGFTIAYSLVSVLALIWLIVAAGNAPFVPLWDQALWQRWLANLVMPFALGLVVFSLGVPNPLSFGGRATGFDPAQPGIAGVVRHPVLWALALWSLVHLVVNGDLAHVILFGSFAGFSLLGMRAIDQRMQARLGLGHWQGLAQNTSAWPCAALLAGRWHPRLRVGLWRLVLALAVWAGVLMLHGPVIGVVATP